jgi:hypothetical protein
VGFELLDLQLLKTNNDLQSTTQKTEDRETQAPLKTNNDLQNTTQKTEDRATQNPLKTNKCFVDRCLLLVGFVLLDLQFSV